MSCCGKQREQFHSAPTASRPPAGGAIAQRSARSPVAYFEYTGTTSLVVVGPVSGKRYVFDTPGARVAVDPVDKPSVAGVPRLREVFAPA